MDNYLKVGHELFNHNYIKHMECDDRDCILTVANTQNSSSSGSNNNVRDVRYDKQYVFSSTTNEYNDLKSFINKK